MTHFKRLTLTSALLTFGAMAYAEAPTKPEPPTLNLQATANTVVVGDTVKVNLVAQESTGNLAEGYRLTTSNLNSAVELLRKTSGVTYSIQNISSNSVGTGESQPTKWHVRAGLELRSSDLPLMGKLLTELSPFMQIARYETTLSAKEAEKIEGALVKDVTDSFKKKATALAKSLGYRTYEIQNVHYNFSIGDNTPRYSRAMAASAEATSPFPGVDGSSISANTSMSGSIRLLN